VGPSQTSLRVDTNIVVVPVTVTDWADRPITGLVRSAFSVFEDKIEQKVAYFSSEDAPLSVGIVFDCSASMGYKLGKSREAVARFPDVSNPADEFFLITFSSRADLVVPFSRSTEKIRDGLSVARSGGRTALLDATYMALHYFKQARNARRALLIVSDGGENDCRYNQRELRIILRESDVLIYAAGIYEEIAPLANKDSFDGPALLTELAEETGGREFAAGDSRDLPKLVAMIGRELRDQYVLGYTPTNHEADGKYHRIQVRVKRHGTHLSWRPGYYAAAF